MSVLAKFPVTTRIRYSRRGTKWVAALFSFFGEKLFEADASSQNEAREKVMVFQREYRIRMKEARKRDREESAMIRRTKGAAAWISASAFA